MQGYKLIEGATEAYPGTPDACKVAVSPGSVYTIAPKSPCESGEVSGGTGLSTTWLIVGGVVVAGGVAAAILSLRNVQARECGFFVIGSNRSFASAY